MSEQKRYTAQEMRDTADSVAYVKVHVSDTLCVEQYAEKVRSMLRQAADAEEELKLALVTIGNQSDEIAQLKARLEAVVKTCEQHRWKWQSTERTVAEKLQHNSAIDTILRVARGDGGAK